MIVITEEIEEEDSWELKLEEPVKGRVPLSHTGSGFKTVLLVMANLLIVPKLPGIAKKLLFGFEELENNLHPALQRRLFRYLHQKAVAVYRKGESMLGDLRLPISIEQLECDDGDALRLEIESFLHAIRDGTPPVVSGEDGRQALQTAMDIIAQVDEWTRSHW